MTKNKVTADQVFFALQTCPLKVASVGGYSGMDSPVSEVIGYYARYTTEENAHLVEVWPEFAANLVVRPTYEEASQAAFDACKDALDRAVANLEVNRRDHPVGVRWIVHPHKENSDDPMMLFGSWGWKTVSSVPATEKEESA